jgi:asparagine synthase (glutamine-hydrolysing)
MTEPIDLSPDFIRLSPLESGLSFPFDLTSRGVASKLPDDSLPARLTLELIMLEAVCTHPCYVLFSGGRDSSAVLAVATHVARREGLPDPIPVTVIHEKSPHANEVSWQDMVLKHLSIKERVVLTFDGEQTLLSRVARSALARHGLVWPEAIQLHGAIYGRLDRGSVVSGEGGDQLIASRRITPVRTIMRQRPTPSTAQAALLALSPEALRGVQVRRQIARSPLFAWLTPSARSELAAAISRTFRSPLRWNRAIMSVMASKPNAVFTINFETAIREYRHRVINPFLSTRFTHALAAEGGLLGLGDRTAMMRYLFADLLPHAVLARNTKAAFNQTRWGEFEREFARGWSGAGIDPELIDAEKLKAAWLSDDPPPGADYQLHAAWLASSERCVQEAS